MQKESATVLGIGFYPTETMRPMPYSTGLTDSQWEAIKPYLDRQRKRRYDLRHIVVDTMGLLMAVVVHAANVHESRGRLQCWRSSRPCARGFSGSGPIAPTSGNSPRRFTGSGTECWRWWRRRSISAALRCCRSAGSSSTVSLGSTTTGACRWTMSKHAVERGDDQGYRDSVDDQAARLIPKESLTDLHIAPPI